MQYNIYRRRQGFNLKMLTKFSKKIFTCGKSKLENIVKLQHKF